MINLLPDDYKAEVRAGRLNVIILNYIIMTLLAIALLAVLLGLAFVTLSASRQDAQRRVSENNLAISQYSSINAAAERYRSDLGTAKQILDKGINYSDLILKIANTIPSGVVLTSLNLDAKSIGSPMIINIYAKDQAAVLQFKQALQSHPELFSDVSLQSIEAKEGDVKNPYSYSATVNVTISRQALQ